MASFDTDVLVAGAGPVGLTLACELARYGVSCRVIDKNASIHEISKALILHVRTQEVLDAMGAIAAAKEVSVPMVKIALRAYGTLLGHLDADEIDSPHSHPCILGQNRTEHLLEEHLNKLGSKVDWEVEVKDFEQDENGVNVTLVHSDGSQEVTRAKYLIGCDGAHSIVRKTLGLSFDGGKYKGEQFIQADAKISWTLPKGTSYLFLTEEGYMMVIEMPDNLVRVFISVSDPDPENESPPTLQEVQDALNHLGGVEAELFEPKWLARYRTSHRCVDRLQEKRVFVAGDAAHIHVPIGGQGMNTGIQDAFNLGWKLAYTLKGKSPATLLDTYNIERLPIAKTLLSGTDRSYRTVLHPGELQQNAVRLIGPFLIGQKSISSKIIHTISEVEISYKETSPIVEDSGRNDGPTAGERAPSAPIVRYQDKSTVELFDIFRGTHWTFLLLGGPKATVQTYQKLTDIGNTVSEQYGQTVIPHLVINAALPPDFLNWNGSTLMDSERYLHDKYGASSACLYLIRPDWYIGFRGDLSDASQLQTYLNSILIQRN